MGSNNELNLSDSGAPMSETDQKIRRASIRAILADNGLTQIERNRMVQGLMDGRRRSSVISDSTGEYSRRGSGFVSDVDDCHSLSGYVSAESSSPQRRSSVNSFRLQGKRSFSGASEILAHEICCNVSRSNSMVNPCPRCTHYERNCNIVSPCCGMLFGCRICHDECDDLPPPMKRSSLCNDPDCLTPATTIFPLENVVTPRSSFCSLLLPEIEDSHHTLDRHAIEEVICKSCNTRQSSKTNNCINCNIQFGEYHCSICNLWMSNDEKPYHCQDCGFCRIGGAENFRHCKDCGMCISVSTFADHDCKEGRYKSACPVCQEDLFSSRSVCHGMQCGHAIHWNCFQDLIKFDSRCPVCKKTSDTFENMMYTWEAMAVSVAMQPVPTEMCKLVTIQCNDCEKKEKDRWWHVIGIQCKSCLSFNTCVEEIQLTGEEARNKMGGEEASTKKEIDDANALVLETGKWLSDNVSHEDFSDSDTEE